MLSDYKVWILFYIDFKSRHLINENIYAFKIMKNRFQRKNSNAYILTICQFLIVICHFRLACFN